jgi:hypothetical protein
MSTANAVQYAVFLIVGDSIASPASILQPRWTGS